MNWRGVSSEENSGDRLVLLGGLDLVWPVGRGDGLLGGVVSTGMVDGGQAMIWAMSVSLVGVVAILGFLVVRLCYHLEARSREIVAFTTSWERMVEKFLSDAAIAQIHALERRQNSFSAPGQMAVNPVPLEQSFSDEQIDKLPYNMPSI